MHSSIFSTNCCMKEVGNAVFLLLLLLFFVCLFVCLVIVIVVLLRKLVSFS